jgi:oligopeptide transport system substrate-binding protein
MSPAVRKAFPLIVGVAAFAALAWAISFGTLPEADFTFNNGTEAKTVDPPRATGAPEGRIINALFEGLYRTHPKGIEFDDSGNVLNWPEPDASGNVPIEPSPAMAEKCEVSADGKTYTFTIREGALWSNRAGTITEPVTAHDFVWSWRRMLHPDTASRYAYQLTAYVVGSAKYNSGKVEVGDRVEVELADRKEREQNFPRGTILRGVLQNVTAPPKPRILLDKNADKEKKKKAQAEWMSRRVYYVDIKPKSSTGVDWDAKGKLKAFSKKPSESMSDFVSEKSEATDGDSDAAATSETVSTSVTVEECMHVLYDFDSQVGIQAPDERTLVVDLMNRTPFFLDLVAFYPLYPVNKNCVEKHGSPEWTKADNIVSNGPFHLEFHRIRDRIRLSRNPNYWNPKVVKLSSIDALTVEQDTTGLNLFLKGQSDWQPSPPSFLIPDLKKRDDFIAAPGMITYFYRINITKPPLDDVHVRRALNMAIDKQLICDKVLKAGQEPARNIVPPGTSGGYVSPECGPYDPKAAREELAKSEYARTGKAFPTIEILYNTHEAHRDIAEVIQQQWKNNLDIDVKLVNMEWTSYLDSVHQKQYSVARAGWIGDYPDPNTFLDMWVTDGENNETGWSNAKYDQLIRDAAAETDSQKRLAIFERAERILMDEQPIIPIYFYMVVNMVNPRVQGFYPNIQDLHPLHLLRVK